MLKRDPASPPCAGGQAGKTAHTPFREAVRTPVSLLAVHSGIGAGDRRTGEGPRALAQAGLYGWLAEPAFAPRLHDIAVRDQGAAPNGVTRLDAVTQVASRLAATAEQTVRSGRRMLVVGGDHSIAMGSWSGGANALPAESRLGLIWLDAHMDAHVPETSPSGNWHGMPVAHLLGYGACELTGLVRSGPAVQPEHLCLIGTRSYEPEEAEFLERLGVRVITAREVATRGFADCFAEALRRIRTGTAGFGLSLDLDALDPEDAPGVGSPVAGGLSADAVTAGLRGLSAMPDFLGLEVAEFNPTRDIRTRTADVVRKLLKAVFEAGARP